MSSQVLVDFGGGKQYQFHLTSNDVAAVSPNDAQGWLDEQWIALGCEPVRPSSKVLLLDKVLGVAREGGDQHFATNDAWAQSFIRNVARLVARPVVVVDVAGNRVG
jgi:hypothetical protein